MTEQALMEVMTAAANPRRGASRLRLLDPALIGAVLIAALIVLALVAPMVSGHDPALNNLAQRLQPPSGQHWFGTDQFGRDLFTRVFVAARIDLLLGLLGALIPAVIGIGLGCAAGYFGRWVGTIVLRLADVIQSFPNYILVIALVLLLGPGPKSFLVGAAISAWVTYARLVRGVVLRIRSNDYIAAAQAAGLGHRRVLTRHVLPNALPQAIVYGASDLVLSLGFLCSLSYLGLGVQPPAIEWGQIIAEGQTFLRTQWWISIAPGLAIIYVGIAVRLIAVGMERRTTE
jgi:peptide/nickel transport system permease protein